MSFAIEAPTKKHSTSFAQRNRPSHKVMKAVIQSNKLAGFLVQKTLNSIEKNEAGITPF